MIGTMRTAGVLSAAVAVSLAAAGPPGSDLAALEAQRKQLEREVRDTLRKQLSAIEKHLAAGADLAELRAAVEAAENALKAKEKSDPQITAAERAYKGASDAYIKARAAAIAADPNVAARKREIEAQYARSDAAEKAKDEADEKLDEIKKALAKSAPLAAAARKVASLSDALDDLPKTDTALAVAHKAVEAAEKAYDRARHALPEYKARIAAEKAYEDARQALPEYRKRKEDPAAYEKARHAMPQYKARNDAREAYDKARHALAEYAALQRAEDAFKKLVASSPAVRMATERLAAARAEHKAKLADALAADPPAAALLERIKQADAEIAAARKERSRIRGAMEEAGRAAYRADPKVLELRKARDDAYAARKSIIRRNTQAEGKALDDARDALENALKAKLAADVRAAALIEQIEATETKIDQLRKQIKAARS